MVDTVVLHIGRHKTGSTSIQETLIRNARLLRRRRILYTNRLPTCHSAFFVDAFSDNPVANPVHNRLGRTEAEIQAKVANDLRKLRDEINVFKPHTVIFSGEDACSRLSAEGISRMKATLTTIYRPTRFRIIFYTRHPISFAQSAIQQNVKANGVTLNDAKDYFVKGGGLRYADVHEKYVGVFGQEAVEFLSFEKESTAPEGLVAGFFRHLQISVEGLQLHRMNESICSEVVRFMSWLLESPTLAPNEQLKLQQNRQPRVPVTEEDRRVLFSLSGSNGGLLSGRDEQTLWNAVADDVAFLKKAYQIEYLPPEPLNDNGCDGLSTGFINQCKKVLPQLSPSLRQELKKFLKLNENALNL